MKGLAWTKLPDRKLVDTFWADLDFNKKIKFEFKEIEELFGDTRAEVKKKEKKQEEVTGNKKVTVIDGNKAQTVGLLLARWKLDHKVIRNAILSVDDSVLTTQMVKSLHKYCPTGEDLELIDMFLKKQAELPAEKRNLLGPTEEFFQAIRNIPQLELRLKFFEYKSELMEKLEDIKPDVDVLKHAVKQWRTSKKWPKIMELLLHLGNFMNNGTFRANANGFKLDTLLKLTDTRMADRKHNLMHYLARILERDHKDLIDFPDELDECEAAANVNLPTVKGEIGKLLGGLRQLGKVLETFKPMPEDEDKFVPVMTEFYESANGVVTKLDAVFSKTEAAFRKHVAYFCEDGEKAEAEAIFGILWKFCDNFKQAMDENHREEAAAIREKEREEAKAKREKGKAAKKDASKELDTAEEEGLVDDIMTNLQEGNVFRARRN